MTGWTARLSPWLAVGTSPSALLLGAELARRHDGALPLALAPVGALAMAFVLWPQSLFGLAGAEPGRSLSQVARAHLSPGGDRLLIVMVTASMAGWLALNLAVGGTATAVWSGLPVPLAVALHGSVVLALGWAGMARWNRVAAPVAGLSAVLAVAILLTGETPSTLTTAGPGDALAGDVALFVGYVAVFAVRAPDFVVGLGRRRDLAALVGALVATTLLVAGAGALASDPRAGGSPVTALLETGHGGAALLISLSTLAPALAAQHSGSLGLARWAGSARGLPLIGLAGSALAVARFDLVFGDWLRLLAVAATPVVVPLAAERIRRHRGARARSVPLWAWLPGAVTGVALEAAGDERALAAAAAATAAATAFWLARGRRD